jgi:hypothetical protein
VKAAGPRARLGQDAPDHPLGRDQIGKLELDVHQLFTQVLGLPSELVAALPDPIEQPRRSSPPSGMNTPDRPQTSPPTSAFKLERSQ